MSNSFLGISSNNVKARLNMLEDSVNSTRINGSANGCGTLGQRGSGGSSVFTPISRLIPPVAPDQTPWQVTVTTASGSTDEWFASVNVQSDLLKSLRPNDNLTVAGLGVTFPFVANDLIALYITVSGYVAVSAVIQSYGAGTTHFDPTLPAWDSGDDSYVFDSGATPPQQIGINVLLAYSTALTAGFYFVQACSDHLLLENCFIDSEPAIYPFPTTYRRYGITPP